MSHKSQVLLHHIYNIIRNAEHPEIQTLNQLLEKLFGRKRCTWHAFQRLMYWMQYSVRPDGSVYKSSRELGDEIGCSDKTVDRAIPALRDTAFDIYIKKAEGAPTRHFKVNEERLIENIARVFGLSVPDTRIFMELDSLLDAPVPTAEEMNSDISTGETVDSDISADFSTDTSPSEPPQPVRMQNRKMSKSYTRTVDREDISFSSQRFSSFAQKVEARRWCALLDTKPETIDTWVRTYGFDMVQATILEAANKERDGKIRKSKFGWVRAALKAKHANERYRNI